MQKRKAKTMNNENDPRHEIAMAIHHISVLMMKKTISTNTLIELEAAKSWLKLAQDKVNN
tara:strand:+ start:406 stop:585 length:180 start_codon:yes stop_codon:yes gene_type:complete